MISVQQVKKREGTNALLLECLGRGRGVAMGVLQRARSIDQAEVTARRRNSLCSLSSSTLSSSPSNAATPTLAAADRDGLMFTFTNMTARSSTKVRDTNNDTEDDATDLDSEYSTQCAWRSRAKRHSQRNSNSCGMQRSLSVFDDSDDGPLVFPKLFSWDWPFCDEEFARGVYMENKLTICLPFNKGGTGETRGSTKKFDKIADCNFLWTVGLSSGGDEIYGATCFWRMEIEVIRSLNMLSLIVSRCVTRSQNIASKRLKRLRKVYRLPDHYDISTLKSTSYDWGILIEAYRRQKTIGLARHERTMIHSFSIAN